MLTILPESGDNYLPVFRTVHGFCTGEEIFSLSDSVLLLEQMKLCTSYKEGGGEKEDSAAGNEVTNMHVHVLSNM